MKFALVLMALIFSSSSVFSSELDNESSVINAKSEMDGTVIIRVNELTGDVEKLVLDRVLEEGQQLATSEEDKFVAVPTSQVIADLDELDQMQAQPTWFFCFICVGNRSHHGHRVVQTSYHHYWYGGYSYNPFYQYSYAQYSYYHYSHYYYQHRYPVRWGWY